MNAIMQTPEPYNEPIKGYMAGSEERLALERELNRQYETPIDIPLIIGGREIRTGNTAQVVCPHEHGHVLAEYHLAGAEEVGQAIAAAMAAKVEWQRLPWTDRAAVFLKMADLISERFGPILNAATMLNQSKNLFQAEIDATCELADFLRFNVRFMEEIYSGQPRSAPGMWNRVEYRPLEGFILAVSPFNFTAIGGNLATAPAMMGNTVVWKPSSTAILSSYRLMELYRRAGLPDGVINFIPGHSSIVGDPLLESENLAGIHFTGSTGVFTRMWRKVSDNLTRYRSYPRMVGETGGKDYIFMHESANVEDVAVAAVQGAFQYQGQKCSAASRMYVPSSRWDELKPLLLEEVAQLRIGDVRNLDGNFNAVIDERSFDNAMSYIERAHAAPEAEIIVGGGGDKSRGYFVEPTIIVASDPRFVTMEEEIFAPVLTIHVYADDNLEEMLDLIDGTSTYALTGAIFARDRHIIRMLTERLTHTAGNFYINDKPSGAVVGLQPFGGARCSGTNDKAGSHLNLLRWTSARTIKETFGAPA
ncbi:MAG: L-glutamate gamma-semialdehyde dehydrogenase [bacterium]|nr:L-glutamate gamma-semialdehyde dehydrogenase [bacterium]